MGDSTNTPPTSGTPASTRPATKPAWARKPAWATKPTQADTPPAKKEDMWSHGSRFAEIQAEKERLKQEKADKQRKKEERKEAKRRRISREDEDEGNSVIESCENRFGRGEEHTPTSTNRHNSGSSSKKPSNTIVPEFTASRKPPSSANIISIDSDSDDPPPKQDATSQKPAKAYVNTAHYSDDDYDPELQALVAAARSNITERSPSKPQKQAQPEHSASSRSTAKEHSSTAVSSSLKPLVDDSPEKPDPPLRVLVHSAIPDTQALIVIRRLSQRTQEVREAWIQRQTNLPPHIPPNKIFLAFRNIRVYDSTALSSLGLYVDEDGRVFLSKGRGERAEYVAGGPRFDDQDQEPGIALEAVTQEILEEKRRKKRSPWETDDLDDENDGGVDLEDGGEPQPPQPQGIKVFLKAKAHEDVKLSVKPDTTFEKIANVFRNLRKVPAKNDVSLHFDGEKLEPADTVQDLEIEDMDAIEVHIK